MGKYGWAGRSALCVVLSLMMSRPNSCCLVGVCFLGFVHSYSSSSFSCSHLSPTASNSNPLYLKMADFRKALNAKSKFTGLKICLTNQGRPYTSALEMEMSMNDNSINAQQSASLAMNSHSFTLQFPYFLETLCPYVEKYGCTTILRADFRTNTVKYGQAGSNFAQLQA